MKKDCISVIVPVYNVSAYIEKCLDSILSQSYELLQIILVDDGSTDGSGVICDRYAENDDRIRVIHKANGGLVSARKAGLKIAEGEYIGFIDADDFVDVDFYSTMLEDLKSNEVDFVHSAEIIEDKDGERILDAYECGIYSVSAGCTDFIITYMLNTDEQHYMSNGVVSKLFKSELIKECYLQVPDDQSIGEDMICTCLCLLNSDKVFLDDAARYHYVQRKESLLHNGSELDYIMERSGLYKCLRAVFADYGVLKSLKKPLQDYYEGILRGPFVSKYRENILLFEFAEISKLKNRKVILYGAGKVGQDYYSQLCKYPDIDIVLWVDKNHLNLSFDYMDVSSTSAIKGVDYDYILIAVAKKEMAEEIKEELLNMDINEHQVLWKNPKYII